MISTSIAVVDALNSLLEAEADSIFQLMGEGSPYLTRVSEPLRPPILKMVADIHQHARELANWVVQLGGTPVHTDHIQPDDHYLRFLPGKFLLPKLASAKELCISRYRNTVGAIERQASPELLSMLKRHLAEDQADLELLNRVAAGARAESASSAH